MDYVQLTLFITACLGLITGINGSKCDAPEKPEKNIDLVSEDSLSNKYKKGEVVVWECKKGQGFGTVWLECEGNNKWSKPNKKCKEQIPFEYGSLSGILCAAFTIVLEIIFVFFATKLAKKKQEDEDVEMRIMEAAKATGTANAANA